MRKKCETKKSSPKKVEKDGHSNIRNSGCRPTFDKIVAELSVQAREAAVTAKEQAAVAAAAAQAAATAAAAGAASNEHSRNPSVAGGGAYGGGAPADSPHGSARVLAHHGGRESAAGHSPGLSPVRIPTPTYKSRVKD